MNKPNHTRRIKRIEGKLKLIEGKYPNYDFNNSELRRDIQEYWKLKNELVYAIVDKKACISDNKDFMCSHCNCWKSKVVGL